MIVLDAVIGSDTQRSDLRWESATESDLRYDCFLGDLVFVASGLKLSTDWGWVPVLDLAVGFAAIVQQLERGTTAHFEFTESEAVIRFERREQMVDIVGNYVAGRAAVTYPDLRRSVLRFREGVRERVIERQPNLAHNLAFRGLIERTLGQEPENQS